MNFKADSRLNLFGETVYNPRTKTFIYMGGCDPHNRKKSNKVIQYDFRS
jgi:hypothetical protein